MILTTRNLSDYLLSRGLLSYDTIVDGDLIITDASHRNRAFRVLRGPNPGYFIKQIRQWDPVSIACWEQEDACYRRLSRERFLPKHYASDVESRIIVIALASASETLSQYHRRLGSCPVSTGRMQGAALAALHRVTHGTGASGKIPWILSVHETNPAWFDSLSPANARLLEIVQGYPEYCDLLSGLRNAWTPSCLIHGDVKWDNMLICNSESPDPELLLVDWEMGVFGDPCWDIGSVFQAYLNAWLYSMPFHETLSADILVNRAGWPLDSLQPSIRAFWESYAAGIEVDQSASRAMLSRSVRCGAARMIQSAYEMMHPRQDMPPVGAAMLQTSFNILTRPADAIQDLLGIRDE
ncbi:MAG: phosphotransferase [Acidobacteriia bacterium]|nr:phosphotransferase [Terriglobia bacterium]